MIRVVVVLRLFDLSALAYTSALEI